MTANGAGRAVRPIAAAGVLLAFGLAAAPIGVGAASVTSLSARADAIASTVEADQGELALVGERYVQATSLLAAARSREQTARIGLLADARHVAVDRQALRTSAISAYVDAGSASIFALYLTKGTDTAQMGSTYLNVANGQLEGRISVLAGDEHRLGSLGETARKQAQAVTTELAAIKNDRDAALSTLSAERSALSSARGALAALVAERAAAAAKAAEEAAAAAAARAAAAAAAATPSPAATSAGPPSVNAVLTGASSAIPTGSLAAAFAGIRNCESSGNYSLDTGNGYYGAYQFSAGTWSDLGGSGLASSAPSSAQDAAAYRLYQHDGFAAWPECAAILGL